eukprot:m.3110 g.3110  ORF g.3110 m.3110 type:complete len:55 (-) comp3711_c0_seq1:96-260(-)
MLTKLCAGFILFVAAPHSTSLLFCSRITPSADLMIVIFFSVCVTRTISVCLAPC